MGPVSIVWKTVNSIQSYLSLSPMISYRGLKLLKAVYKSTRLPSHSLVILPRIKLSISLIRLKYQDHTAMARLILVGCIEPDITESLTIV